MTTRKSVSAGVRSPSTKTDFNKLTQDELLEKLVDEADWINVGTCFSRTSSTTRKAPKTRASEHQVGTVKLGLDGRWWEVRLDKNGNRRWFFFQK